MCNLSMSFYVSLCAYELASVSGDVTNGEDLHLHMMYPIPNFNHIIVPFILEPIIIFHAFSDRARLSTIKYKNSFFDTIIVPSAFDF